MNSESRLTSTEPDYDLLIVGGGLVGCALALASARTSIVVTTAAKKFNIGVSSKVERPIRIAVVESSSVSSSDDLESSNNHSVYDYDPRVFALSHESQRFLRELGVWSLIERGGSCPYRAMDVWDGDGTEKIRFDAADIRQENLGCIAENRVVRESLYEILRQYKNIDIIDSTRVSSISLPETVHSDPAFFGECVQAVDETLGDNTQANVDETGDEMRKHGFSRDRFARVYTDTDLEFTCSLLVASDGSGSALRKMANFETREWCYQHTAIVATVQTEQSHQYTAWQRFAQEGPLAFLPLRSPDSKNCCAENSVAETLAGSAQRQNKQFKESAQNSFSSIVWSIDSVLAEEMMALGDRDFCLELSKTFEHRLGAVKTVGHRYAFPLVQRHALTYFKPGIALIGDAAHSIHPLAGQGVNLGLADARALAAEIARAGERNLALSDVSVLGRYERQRMTQNLAAMAAMEFFKRSFGSDNPAVRFLRNRGLAVSNTQVWLKKLFTNIAAGYDTL